MPNRIATELLLIARSPTSGRLRHRAALAMCLRAALFAELAFAERIVDSSLTPAVVDRTPTGDRILDAVLDAVYATPRVGWKRWYHHVLADRVALAQELIEAGRWTQERDRFGRVVYLDTDPDATLVLVHNTLQIAELRQAPTDGHQAVLAVLSSMCGSIIGRPKPRELRHSLKPLLAASGSATDPIQLTVQVALQGCATAIRKRSRILP